MSVKGAVFFKVFRLYRSLVTYKSCDSDVSRSFPFFRPTCSPFVCFLYFSSPPLSLSLLPSPFPQRFHRLVARVAAELHPRRRVVSEGGGSFSLLSAGGKNRDRGRGRRRSALSLRSVLLAVITGSFDSPSTNHELAKLTEQAVTLITSESRDESYRRRRQDTETRVHPRIVSGIGNIAI